MAAARKSCRLPFRSPWRLSTQAYLFALVAAVVVPLLAFTGTILSRYVAGERARFDREARDIARQVTLVLDGELRALTALLHATASSPALDEGDIPAFHRQAAELARATGLNIVLRDRDGTPLANPRLALGSPLEALGELREAGREAVRTGNTVISDVFRGPFSGEPVVAIYVPAMRDGQARYLLALGVPTRRFGEAIRPAVPEGWIVGIGDRQGIYVTRSLRHDDVAGKPGIPEYIAKAVGREGTFTAVNFEGRTLLAGYAYSSLTGWLVGANIYQDAVEAPLWRSLKAFGALGALALLLSTGLGLAFGRRLAQAIGSLADGALALGRGAPVRIAPSHLRELDVVRAALARADEEVAARTREREAAAERQRLMMQELNHRVKNMLANVLSIASLTARSADDVATYRARLTERVQGLAKTHDLLSGNEWSGADLRELLASELGLYDDEAGRVRLEGPAVHLPPRLAVGVGMIAHELTTNAVKYGALASGTGRVEVAWRVDAEPSGQRRLHLSWTEAGGPPVAQPTRQGFGTRMIERGLARELDATVVSDYALEGLRFTLSMPLEAEGQPVDPRASRRAEYAKLVQEPEGLRIY